MTDRAFPVIFAQRPSVTADFYERLGFVRHVQLPPEGEPGYIGLQRGSYEVAVVDMSWPADQYGGTVSAGMRFEMFVYVDDVALRSRISVATTSCCVSPPTCRGANESPTSATPMTTLWRSQLRQARYLPKTRIYPVGQGNTVRPGQICRQRSAFAS